MERRIRAERLPRIAADERGAMMVMGVFVSMFLVGALWSIAGMGEVVVMRERLQEAADATALAAAVIDARAMNILVLFNLIMAAILSIRVLLNAIVIGAAIVAAASFILAAIPFIGAVFLALALSAVALGVVVHAIHDEVNPAISKSLTDFDTAMNGIAQVTPALATEAGGIPAMYTPPLAKNQPWAAVGAPTQTSTLPLPVMFGSADSLCDPHAIVAVHTEVDDIMNQSQQSALVRLAQAPLNLAITAVTPIVEANGWLADDLCELGGTNTTGVSGPLSGLSQQCIQNAQGSTPCTNSAPGGPDQQALNDAIRLEPDGGPLVDQAQTSLDTDTGNCTDEQNQCNSQSNKAQQSPPSTVVQVSPTTANAQPMATADPFMFSGSGLAQIYSRLILDPRWALEPTAGLAPSLVAVAARGQVSPGTLPASYDSAVAQSEFFYDCPGRWAGCRDNSMWNYYWRARLKRLWMAFINDSILGAEGSRCQQIVSMGGTCNTGTPDPILQQVASAILTAENDGITHAFQQLQASPSNFKTTVVRDILDPEVPDEGDELMVH
jgi:hypothetical protein